MNRFLLYTSALVMSLLLSSATASVRIKELARIAGVQDNPIIGYGLVVGLSGTGDSNKNRSTVQSLSNTLRSFSINVSADEIRSRNVAAVMVTATLPAYAQVGDKLEVNVSSLGDARSLQGGTLLLTSLNGANGELYALAQGPLSVGGYQFDFNGNRVQKNHPTVGVVPNGAKVERSVEYNFDLLNDGITLVLNQPDFTTADRIAGVLEQRFENATVSSNHPGKITLKLQDEKPLLRLMAEIESLRVNPDNFARVVVNERNGTVVAGSQVRIDDVVISHGALKLKIETRFTASQPLGFFEETPQSISSLVVANSTMEVEEGVADTTTRLPGATIGELVESLQALNLTTRELISVLQAIKKAGALHAELIIQ